MSERMERKQSRLTKFAAAAALAGTALLGAGCSAAEKAFPAPKNLTGVLDAKPDTKIPQLDGAVILPKGTILTRQNEVGTPVKLVPEAQTLDQNIIVTNPLIMEPGGSNVPFRFATQEELNNSQANLSTIAWMDEKGWVEATVNPDSFNATYGQPEVFSKNLTYSELGTTLQARNATANPTDNAGTYYGPNHVESAPGLNVGMASVPNEATIDAIVNQLTAEGYQPDPYTPTVHVHQGDN